MAGQPIAATIGFGTQADIITPFSMDMNGNGITVSNGCGRAQEKAADEGRQAGHPIDPKYLKEVVDDYKKEGKTFKMGMVFPVSTHNYELRYWLAAGGLNPGYYAPAKGDTSGTIKADVPLSVTPPPQMPATMEAGTIDGYCVGEPWNQQAVLKGIGAPVATDYDVQRTTRKSVRRFQEVGGCASQYTRSIVNALIGAGYWLDEENNKNRMEAVQIIAKPNYVGADERSSPTA